MSSSDLERRLHEVTNTLVSELISLTPESMSEIQFEIIATADGGADLGLLENHADAKRVALSDEVYTAASHYLPLVKQYVPGWSRTHLVLQLVGSEWNVQVNFETS